MHLSLPCVAWFNAKDNMPTGKDRDKALLNIYNKARRQQQHEKRIDTLQNEFIDTSPLQVNDTCMQTFPCRHDVALNGVHVGRWSGAQIARWYLDHDYPIPPHFWYCLKVVDFK